MSKTTKEDVVDKFQEFLDVYDKFRKDHGLQDKKVNAYEVCTALGDKNGRIFRQVKHFERNDQKPDWPIGLTEAMTGYLIYMIMLMRGYNVSIHEGMLKELQSAISQWTEKK